MIFGINIREVIRAGIGAIAGLLFAFFVFGGAVAFGQNNGGLLPALPPQFQNAANGKLCTQAAGTTTALATYSDNALTSALPTVISLNALGRPTTSGGTETAIYLQARSYKISLYAAGSSGTCNGQAVGSLVWTRDNVYDLATFYKSVFATLLDDKVCHASQVTGATPNDLGGKIAYCINSVLPSTGGTVDARGLEGAQTISSDFWASVTKPVRVLLPTGTISVSATLGPACNSCSMWGMGQSIGASPTVLKWTGAANGTLLQLGDNSQFEDFRDFVVDGNALAGTGIYVKGLGGGNSSQKTVFTNVTVKNVYGTSPGYCWHVGSSDNPDVSQAVWQNNVAENCKYGLYQEGGQTVQIRYVGWTFSYTGSVTKADVAYHAYFAAGSADMEGVTVLGAATSAQIAVSANALWVRFTDLYMENTSASAGPALQFPAGTRAWPTYLKGARIQWNVDTTHALSLPIIDWNQTDYISITDSVIGTDSAPAGQGVVSFTNGRLRWENSKINGTATISTSIGASVAGFTDTTSLNCDGGSSPCPNISFSGSAREGSIMVHDPQPEYYLKETGAAADNTTWDLGVDGTTLYLRLLNDARNAAGDIMTVTRSGNTVTGLNFPAGISVGGTTGLITSLTAVTSFTPTLTNTTNVSASTPRDVQYLRTGNVITVSGRVDVTTTSSGGTLTVLGISLPIASNLANPWDLAGTADTDPSSSTDHGPIIADTVNDLAQLRFAAQSAGSLPMYFTFTYRVQFILWLFLSRKRHLFYRRKT